MRVDNVCALVRDLIYYVSNIFCLFLMLLRMAANYA